MVVGLFSVWTRWLVGVCVAGWVAGSFRTWVGAFVPVGGGPGLFFGSVCSCSPLYRPALAKFEYEPTHLFAAARTAVLL